MSTQPEIHIVRLDGIHLPSPTFSPTLKHTYKEYPLTTPGEVIARVQNATVVISTTVHVTRATLLACPSIKLVCALAIGTDHVDLVACKELGIAVCNIPAASNESVAEHAISFYFALRRRTVVLHGLVKEGSQWKEKGSLKGVFGKEFPICAKDEVVGIIGPGELGNRVAMICRALGMSVLLLDRKPSPETKDPSPPTKPGRTPFLTGLPLCTVVVITCPLNPSTRNLISTHEFDLMRPDSLLINVARGGIVDEDALVLALKEEKIMGAATDVFAVEPATSANSVLVRAAREGWSEGRLVLSPHVAWCAQSSIAKLRETVVLNIEGWVGGEPVNLVV